MMVCKTSCHGLRDEVIHAGCQGFGAVVGRRVGGQLTHDRQMLAALFAVADLFGGR